MFPRLCHSLWSLLHFISKAKVVESLENPRILRTLKSGNPFLNVGYTRGAAEADARRSLVRRLVHGLVPGQYLYYRLRTRRLLRTLDLECTCKYFCSQSPSIIISARNRSLGQDYIFTGVCHSVNRGVCLSACWDTPLCQGDPPRQRDPPAKETPPPDPHPGGKLKGIKSRPTAKGEIQGDQIQTHTPRGKFRGIRTPPTTTTAAGGTHPTGMHSCFSCLNKCCKNIFCSSFVGHFQRMNFCVFCRMESWRWRWVSHRKTAWPAQRGTQTGNASSREGRGVNSTSV